ncbi:collagen alpha-1(I) chain-like isoform X6 [Columba livia]|uniref:collagen alpha-1(I) chain-like isoform X6 n=1 Tax=Columba livia TaxID=8932 RepID=UPI0031BAAA25
MTRGRPGEAAGGPALCGRGAHGVEGFLGAPRGFLWRDSSSRSHRHGDGRGPLARGLSSLEPGPGTRSRGVRKSRGGAVTAPVLSRPPSPGGGSSAGAGDAAPSSVPSVPGGGCRPVGRGCGCSGHCPPIFGGSGCGGAGQGSPGCAETAGRLLVEQSQGQLLRNAALVRVPQHTCVCPAGYAGGARQGGQTAEWTRCQRLRNELGLL